MTRPDDPLIPLDYREGQVVKWLGHGWSYKRIGEKLGIKESTVAGYAMRAAEKFSNPDDLSPQMLLTLYAAHRRWEAEREAAA